MVSEQFHPRQEVVASDWVGISDPRKIPSRWRSVTADRPSSVSGYGGAPAYRPSSLSGYGGAPVVRPSSLSEQGYPRQQMVWSDWCGWYVPRKPPKFLPALAADRPYTLPGYGGGPDRSVSNERLGAIGLGSSACKIPSRFQSRSVELAPAREPHLLRQVRDPSDLRRRLGSAELSGGLERRLVKVPGSIPGKIPKPCDDLGKMAKSVVTYEEDASDPTAVWRVAHMRPSEEPRNESFLIQPREMETTRRSDELRRINLKSTQEIQPRGAPEGNLKPPLTGLSEVDEVFGKHEVRLEEVIDGLDGAVSGDFGIPSWLFRTPDYMAPEQWNHQKPSQGPDLAKQWLQNPRRHLNPSQFQYLARQWNSNSSSDRAPSFFKSLAKGPILDSPESVGGEPLVGAVAQKKETEMKSFTPGACKYCGYKGFSGHKCKQNQHVDLIASEVIVGPDCAGLNMKKGEVALVTIPPEDAIGFTELNQDLAVIPTNSTWIQEVELVLIVKDKESVYALAMNDTGNLLVPGGIEQVVHVWDPGTGSKNMKWQSSPLGVGGGLTFGVVSAAGRAQPHQILDMTDDEADFHMRQGAFLYNFDAQMLPKGYHCFSRRLMLEYSKFSSLDSDEPFACKLNDPKHRNTYKQVYVHVLNYEAILWEKLPKLSMQQLYFVSLLWNLPPWPDLSFCEVHWRAMGMEKGTGAVSRRNAYNMVTRQGKNQFQPTRDKQLTDFVKEWVARVEQYKLKDNEWFSALYSCRKQWAPGYVDHSFWASERGLGIYDDFYVCGHEYLEDIIYIGAREHELEEFLLSVMKEVKDIGFTGASRLIFRPLVDELTCFGAVCFSLRQKKQLDFRLWVIGDEISVILGNSDTLEDTIKNAIEDSITWSLRKVVPIIPGDYSGLELKSVGIVEVNLGQARDLTNKDVIGKSDPFAILYVPPLPDHTKRSKTINKYADTHSVTVKIYDGDGIQGSELIGCVQVVLNDLQKSKVKDVWLKLVQELEILRDRKNWGQEHLELLYCPSDMKDEAYTVERDMRPVAEGAVQGHTLFVVTSKQPEVDGLKGLDVVEVKVGECEIKADQNCNIIVDHKRLSETTHQASCAPIDINSPESTGDPRNSDAVNQMNIHGNGAMASTIEQVVAAHLEIRSSLHFIEVIQSSKALLKGVMQTWLPAGNALLGMVIFHLSSPSTAQKYSVENLYERSLDDIYATAIRNCDLDGKVATGLKNLALTGVSCGHKGALILIHEDFIEKSFWSRQFLFRDWNTGLANSTVAAVVACATNSCLHTDALQNCACPETEYVFPMHSGRPLILSLMQLITSRLGCIWYCLGFLISILEDKYVLKGEEISEPAKNESEDQCCFLEMIPLRQFFQFHQRSGLRVSGGVASTVNISNVNACLLILTSVFICNRDFA